MNRYMLEEFHRNPALLRSRLTAQARQQRALAVGEAIAALFAGIGRLFGYAKAHLAPRPQRWIERLG